MNLEKFFDRSADNVIYRDSLTLKTQERKVFNSMMHRINIGYDKL